MSEIVQDYIEGYIRKLIPNNHSEMDAFRRRALKDEVPVIYREVQQHLELLIAANKINAILEVGTAVGFSASVFAKAMGKAGNVDTIERSAELVSQAKENIQSLGLENQVNCIHGDAMALVPQLDKTYDMIFLDGAKGHYIHLLEDCLRLLKPGGLLISDNVLYQGMVATDELVIRRKITIVKRMRIYLDTIACHPLLITSILPLGDGLAICYKKMNNGEQV